MDETKENDVKVPRVLYVCGGNQGRSVLCHYITLLHHAPCHHVMSAGLYADQVDPWPDKQAVIILGKHAPCNSILSHTPTQLTPEVIESVNPDYILLATRSQECAVNAVSLPNSILIQSKLCKHGHHHA
eukprot:m.62987 g.62987  ORF g.62987 m.62987 type:complete len:129 (+) comp11551_c0_seq2:392-778(+)